MFSDPVNFIDPNGKFLFNLIGGAVGALLGGIDASNNPNATFGSILTGIFVGGATGAIGLNTFTLAKVLWVAAINYGGDITNQLIQGTNDLDHSKAIFAAIVGTTGGLSSLYKLKESGEISDFIYKLVVARLNGKLVSIEGCMGK